MTIEFNITVKDKDLTVHYNGDILKITDEDGDIITMDYNLDFTQQLSEMIQNVIYIIEACDNATKEMQLQIS